MCFDLDARPPIALIEGGALDGRRETLTAEDGNRFAAFRARAAEPSGAGVVVLPDVRGLVPYYEELALRFAEHGADAIAIDYFGRTAGLTERGGDFDHQAHASQATWAGISADIRAGAMAIRSEEGRVRSLFTVGFCFGGRNSFLAAILGLDLAGVIGFYGVPLGASKIGSPAPAEVADRIGSPVLALFGGADQAIPPEAVETFGKALEAAGVEHRIVTYEGAPHSFFDRKQDEYAEASAAAWAETIGFVRGHTS